MTWAPKETQITIYTLLNNDATLISLLGGANRVFDFVPDNTPYPYIVMQIKPWGDRANQNFDGMDASITIHIFYRGPGRGDKKVQEIQERINALLHAQDICIDGWNIVSFRRELIDILIEEDNVTLHGIQVFNLMIGEA